jgi:hypothetical protein
MQVVLLLSCCYEFTFFLDTKNISWFKSPICYKLNVHIAMNKCQKGLNVI